MKQMSSFDLYFLIYELQDFIGSRLDTFYFNNNIFSIKIYQKYKGQSYIISKLGEYLYFDVKRDEGSNATPFIQYLRKNIANGFIRKIEQVNFERILKFTIEKKNEEEIKTYYIYLELFAPGNVILTNINNTIQNLLYRKNFKDRILKIKGDYLLPPTKELALIDLDIKKLNEQINKSDLVVVKFLAIALGIGGKYSEEICALSKINKNQKSKKITNNECLSIEKSIKNLLKNKIDGQLIIDKDKRPKDFIPFKFKSLDNFKKMNSFNETLKEYFKANKVQKDHKEEQFLHELKKLQTRLLKQEKMLKEVEKSYKEYNGIGNKIYENYLQINEILKMAKTNIKSLNNNINNNIKKINPKNNEIIIEI